MGTEESHTPQPELTVSAILRVAAADLRWCCDEAWWLWCINIRNPMNPPRSKLRGITRKGIVCETPRFLTLFPLQGNLEASSEESPD